MPFSSSTFLAKIDPNHYNFQSKEVKLVALPESLSLEIVASSFLKIEELSKKLYSLYNELFYLFDYLIIR